MPTPLQRIKKFDPNDYYSAEVDVIEDKASGEKKVIGETIRFQSQAMKLLIAYYAEKFQTKISHLDYDCYLQQLAEDRNKGQNPSDPLFMLIKKVKHLIEEKKDVSNYREVILYDPLGDHVTPIAFIIENGEIGFVILEALGDSKNKYQPFIDKMWEEFHLPTYGLQRPRQAGDPFCRIDALVFAKEITGINSETNQYLFPNFLFSIKQRSEQISENYFLIKLPNKFLITARRSDFIKENRENPQEIIHIYQGKEETLDDILKRYQHPEFFTNDFVRQKSLKQARIVEIMFYVNQLKEIIGNDWEKSYQKKFIKEAKLILKANPGESGNQKLYEFTNACAEDLSELILRPNSLSEILNLLKTYVAEKVGRATSKESDSGLVSKFSIYSPEPKRPTGDLPTASNESIKSIKK